MRAAVLRHASRPLDIEELQVDEPAPNEILVRTVASGVCHSDLHFIDGHFPLSFAGEGVTQVVLGHEGAGVVEAVGSAVTYVAPGDHVVACLSSFCGSCEQCLSGHPNRCSVSTPLPVARRSTGPSRLSLDGAPVAQLMDIGSFASTMLLHENSVVKIDADIPLEHAALLSCGVLTGVGAALRTARVEPASTVAVFGCGGVGLAIVQGAVIAGARQIIGVDVVDAKAEVLQALGGTHFVNASSGDAVEQIRMITNGRGVDYAFDALGTPVLTRQAVESLATGGAATIVGSMSPTDVLEMPARALSFEKRLQSSLMGSNRFRIDIPRYLDLYRQGRLQLDRMVSHRFGLDDVNEAFDVMRRGEAARSVLLFD